MRLTIDANVFGDVMFESAWTQIAEDYLSAGHSLFAPSVLISELLSIATKRHRLQGVPASVCRERWERALEVEVTYVPDSCVADVAFDLAVSMQHPSDDCLYLATAIAYDAPLVTRDRVLHDRAIAAGLGEHVLWVEDPPPASA